MASPVDTSVKFFHSGMAGAPVMKGQAGALIAVLDACLKDGFGLQVINTLVVASGVATATLPATPAAVVGSVVLIAGASIVALNGEQKVTAVVGNTVQFATAAANGSATGAMTLKMAPLGFTKPYAGTNLAVYKPSDLTAYGNYLQVDDTGTTDARAVGYETMTALSTGTGMFPTAAQIPGGMYWSKAYQANETAVAWALVGDSRFFYLLPAATYSPHQSPSAIAWGDPVPLGKAPDPYSTLLIGKQGADFGSGPMHGHLSGFYTEYCARDVLATGTAVAMSCVPVCQASADPVFDRVSGRLQLTPIYAKTNGKASHRFAMPGVFLGLNGGVESVIGNRTLFYAGSPEKTYLAVYVGEGMYSQTYYLAAFDITGPWR